LPYVPQNILFRDVVGEQLLLRVFVVYFTCVPREMLVDMCVQALQPSDQQILQQSILSVELLHLLISITLLVPATDLAPRAP
jgi:hypothetical protein